MKTKQVGLLFDKFSGVDSDEYLSFDRVENKLSTRPDLHAFLRLDRLFPSDDDIISAATHDQFWIGIDGDDFAKVATEELILELSRCGVGWEEDSLYMFV